MGSKDSIFKGDGGEEDVLSSGGETGEGTARRFPKVPLIFLGLALYRAWIEIVYVGSFSEFPIQSAASRDVFDLSASVVWIVLALVAKRIAPLSKRKSPFVVAGSLLVVATVVIFASSSNPGFWAPFALPIAAMAGVGIALLILLWSEFFGCLNPLRVALYYSASIILGALIIYLYQGLIPSYLGPLTTVLPLLSALMVYLSFKKLPQSELPHSTKTAFTFPWKPALLMAVYSFAYGMKETTLYDFFGPHSSPGVVVAALVVLVGVIYQGKRFDFGVIYRFGLPFMVAAFLLVPALGFPDEGISSFCVTVSYTAFSILIMIILSNMAYRYGMNALWLFGIERGVRQVFMFAGREAEPLLQQILPPSISGGMVENVIIVLLILATTMIMLSEKDLISRWGVTVIDGSKSLGDEQKDRTQNILGERCALIAKEHGLSVRESEVLLLLAQKKSISLIEKELFIANGTAKAHVRHIYQKLNIHSREELFELIEG